MTTKQEGVKIPKTINNNNQIPGLQVQTAAVRRLVEAGGHQPAHLAAGRVPRQLKLHVTLACGNRAEKKSASREESAAEREAASDLIQEAASGETEDSV